MPLYEYQCDQCGHRFEVIQKFSDAPLDRCPKCEGAVRKLQSAPAFHLKGSGWYITDYAKKDAPKKDAPGADGDKKPAEKTASSDTKPDTAKDSSKTTASTAEPRPPDTPKSGPPGQGA